MAKKSKPKKPKKDKSLVSKGVETGKKLFGKDKKENGKRRKKSALFYAREIQRLKLKKRYEKIKMGV